MVRIKGNHKQDALQQFVIYGGNLIKASKGRRAMHQIPHTINHSGRQQFRQQLFTHWQTQRQTTRRVALCAAT